MLRAVEKQALHIVMMKQGVRQNKIRDEIDLDLDFITNGNFIGETNVKR